jgi:hypothetical protein
MKTAHTLALAACLGIILAPIAAQLGRGDTNKVAIASLPAALDAESPSLMPGSSTRGPIKLLSVAKSPEGVISADPGAIVEEGTNKWFKASGALSNGWVKLPPEMLKPTDTNAVMALPYIRQALMQAFGEGIQFGTLASIQNKTLVQMEDHKGLEKAAMFLRFGPQRK